MNVVPEGWKEVRLGEVCDVISGAAFKSSEFTDDGLRLIRGSNVKRGHLDWSPSITVHWPNATGFEQYLIEAGDIIVAMDGYVGRSHAYIHNTPTPPQLLVQRVARIRPQSIEPSVLYACICTHRFFAHCERLKTATGIAHISLENIRDYWVTLPSLKEQRRISEILSDADASIATAKRLLSASCKKRDGLRGHCFKHLSEKSTPRLITQHYEFVNGMAFKPTDWSKSGRPIIRIQNLTDPSAEYNYYEGRVDTKYIIEHGDFLLSWSATLDCFIWGGQEAVLNQHIFKVLPKEGNSLLFGYHLMKHFLHLMKGKVHGSSMKHLTKKDLDKIKMPIPDYDMQGQVAQALTVSDKEILKHEQRLAALKKLKRGLMQQLLTGKMRVPEKQGKDT